ncbi:MAG: hypothetical protein MZV64_28365 [Ignavibacteriales bacterium]|nr:hypothetical protein [Ignavibacteriales bacterium]
MAVSRLPSGVLNYHNAGKVQASSEPQDMRLQRMLGHLTTLVPERPTSVFVIGFGAGVTAGAVSIDPRVERVTIAEIEPLGAAHGVRVLQRATTSTSPATRRCTMPDRRRAALPADDEREVRRHHVRPARPVGEGRRDALLARVLRPGEAAPEPGRRGHAVRAALLEQRGGREERDRDLLRGVPATASCSATPSTAPATTSCCSARLDPARSTSTRSPRASISRSTRRSRASLREVGLLVGSSTCCPPTRATRPTSAAGCRTRSSTSDASLRLQHAGLGREPARRRHDLPEHPRAPQGAVRRLHRDRRNGRPCCGTPFRTRRCGDRRAGDGDRRGRPAVQLPRDRAYFVPGAAGPARGHRCPGRRRGVWRSRSPPRRRSGSRRGTPPAAAARAGCAGPA